MKPFIDISDISSHACGFRVIVGVEYFSVVMIVEIEEGSEKTGFTPWPRREEKGYKLSNLNGPTFNRK